MLVISICLSKRVQLYKPSSECLIYNPPRYHIGDEDDRSAVRGFDARNCEEKARIFPELQDR